MQVAVKSSNVNLSQANFTPEQLNSLSIGSVTMQLNELACLLATVCKAKNSILIHAHTLNCETLPLITFVDTLTIKIQDIFHILVTDLHVKDLL